MFRTGSEGCDDSGTISGDGWSSTCSVEVGWQCTGGTTSSKDVCTEICGDGIRFNTVATYCDDGNNISGDGCTSGWSKETGWTWSDGNSSTKDTCIEICGDGIRFNSNATYWDDSNNINGDGWNSSCSIEIGWKCSGGSSSSKDVCTEIWGDGMRFNTNNTYCDDGNLINGDGWNSSCTIETGWNCLGGNSSTKDSCSEIWGDGIRFNSNSSYWDDGNVISDDGWSAIWGIEVGWIWSGGNFNTKDSWFEIWGDGIKFNSNSTYWDDNNTNNYDGWSSSWKIESEYTMK